MPKPRLVKLVAGGDYEEVAIVHFRPALATGQKPILGTYRLVLLYGAAFSNGDEFQRNLGTILWQGEVTATPYPWNCGQPFPILSEYWVAQPRVRTSSRVPAFAFHSATKKGS